MARKKRHPLNKRQKSEFQKLRQLNLEWFGTKGDPSRLKKYARTRANDEWRIKQGRATMDPQARRAGFTVQAEIQPQLRELAHERGAVKRNYADLAKSNKVAAGSINAAGDAASQAIGNRYSNLLGTINSEYGKGQQETDAEANRLGIQGNFGGQSDSERERMAALVSAGKENALSAQNNNSQSFNQMMGLLSGEGRQSGLERRSDINSEMGGIRAGRRAKVYTLMQSLKDASRAEAADRRQQAFMNAIARSRLGGELDYQTAQSLNAMADARKAIVDSRRPRVVHKKKRLP